jgi:predicted dehydrogenase
VAVVGAGSMGSLHARVVAQSPQCTLAAVIDPRPEAADALAQRFGSAARSELDLARIDAVIIAAATPAHHELALQVLAAGLPVLVEKPLADRLDDARAIVAAAAAHDIPLMCGLLERYNPAVMTAMEIVREPVHVSAVRHSPYAARIRTGVASDLLIHDLDLALRVFGAAPESVRGAFSHCHPDSVPGSEDVAEAVLTFPGGGVATISASRIGQRKIRSLSIGEVDQLIEVDLLRRDVTIYRHVANDLAADGIGYRQQTVIEIPALVTAQEPLATQLDRFVALVAGTLDPVAERAAILPAHEALEQVRAGAASPV